MARAKSQRADEDALDPVEAADVEHADDADEGLLELDPEAGLEAEDTDDDDEGPDDLDLEDEPEVDDEPEVGDESTDPAALDAVDVDVDADEDGEPLAVAVIPAAAFDDGDDEVAVVVADDDEGDEIDGVRDGEFVCRNCYMAKRETQLADPERLLCRDCA